MKKNIEIKARAREWQRQQTKARNITTQNEIIIYQEDTYFKASVGRLKLRVIDDRSAFLIFYLRDNMLGPKESIYSLLPIVQSGVDNMKQMLGAALGIIGVVKKTRHLHIIDQARIHFDEVDGLGRFIELEYVQLGSETPVSIMRRLEEIMSCLNIQQGDLIDGSYIDLLLKSKQ